MSYPNRRRAIKWILWSTFLLISGVVFGPLTQGEISETERAIIIGREPMPKGPILCHHCHIPGGE